MILIYILFFALFLMGVFAPFETLGWWAGWYDDLAPDDPRLSLRILSNTEEKLFQETEQVQQKKELQKEEVTAKYMVYLTGVGGVKPERLSNYEMNLLDSLKRSIPELKIVRDVFPYSVSNRALTGERFFSRIWKVIENFKYRKRFQLLGWLINIRNIWQMLVSADNRYGPLYNHATAELIYSGLLRQGYQPGSGKPVVLLGYSGGGQVSAGAAFYLKKMLQAPVHVIGLGGALINATNITSIDSVTLLQGTRDSIPLFAVVTSPYRWRFLPHTGWNQARRKGLVTIRNIGPMKHMLRKGYLDNRAKTSSGESYLSVTTKTISRELKERV
ncbi:MAG: hypothetical protein ACLFR1_15325 [Spirochaetia bacterium]